MVISVAWLFIESSQFVQQTSAVDFLTVCVCVHLRPSLCFHSLSSQPGCVCLQMHNRLHAVHESVLVFWGRLGTLQLESWTIQFQLRCLYLLHSGGNKAEPISICISTPLEYLSMCCFLFLLIPTEQVSVPQKSGLNPVHLCSYEAKEFLLGLILLMVFSLSLNNSSFFLTFPYSPTPPPAFISLSLIQFLSVFPFFHPTLLFFSVSREQPLFCSAGPTMRSMQRLDALDPLTTLVSGSWPMRPFPPPVWQHAYEAIGLNNKWFILQLLFSIRIINCASRNTNIATLAGHVAEKGRKMVKKKVQHE